MNIFRYKQFNIVQEHAAMKVGTDSDLLGTLAAGGHHILDIGTGTGVLSLMMAQRFPEALITAVEIDDNAVLDAQVNFEASPFRDRIHLKHTSFQDYLKEVYPGEQPTHDLTKHDTRKEGARYDCVICNPPYFDKSLEPDDQGRLRARHTSSLPFSVLAQGAYRLLADGGVFSVCIPPEVLSSFNAECLFAGFSLKTLYQIKSLPHKAPKRYVVVHAKGHVEAPETYEFCMRNADHSRSEWYKEQLRDFLL